MQELRIQEETTMKRTCGKTLTLTILAAILAGTVPAFAGDVIGQQVTVDKDRTESLLCGGYTTSGNALTNTLFVTGSASITSDEGAGGGYAENGEAIGNQVIFSSSGSHQIEVVFGGGWYKSQRESGIHHQWNRQRGSIHCRRLR